MAGLEVVALDVPWRSELRVCLLDARDEVLGRAGGDDALMVAAWPAGGVEPDRLHVRQVGAEGTRRSLCPWLVPVSFHLAELAPRDGDGRLEPPGRILRCDPRRHGDAPTLRARRRSRRRARALGGRLLVEVLAIEAGALDDRLVRPLARALLIGARFVRLEEIERARLTLEGARLTLEGAGRHVERVAHRLEHHVPLGELLADAHRLSDFVDEDR